MKHAIEFVPPESGAHLVVAPDAALEEAAWHEKLPLPSPLEKVSTLPEDMLPEPLKRWIVDVATRIGVHIEYVAIIVLVALGSVVGRTIGIYLKQRDNWLEVPNIWGAIVGPPSSKKTPAMNKAISPIRHLTKIALTEFKEAQAARKAAIEIQKIEIETLKRNARKPDIDPSKVQADLAAKYEELNRLEEANAERRYYTSDGTIEKIGEILLTNPRGLLIIRDELTGLLRTMEKPGHEGDRAFYLEGWNGQGSHIVDRISRGTLHLPAITLSIAGGIQPSRLAGYIRDAIDDGGEADGFLQRFQLLVWPDELPDWEYVDDYPDIEAENRAFKIFEKLDKLEPLKLGAVVDPAHPEAIPALRFSAEAQELFIAWLNDLMARVRTKEIKAAPAFGAHLGKYPSLFATLALLFHLVGVADGRTHGPVSVDAAHLAADWCEFLEQHARKVYAPELNGEVLAAHVLAEKIKQGQILDGQSLRDIYRRGWTELRTAEQVAGALAVLCQANWARVELLENDGARPSEIIRLHPSLRKG